MWVLAQATELIKTAERQLDFSREHGPLMYLLVVGIVIMCASWAIKFFYMELPEKKARLRSQDIHDQCALSNRECHQKIVSLIGLLCDDLSDIRRRIGLSNTEKLRAAILEVDLAMSDSKVELPYKSRKNLASDE